MVGLKTPLQTSENGLENFGDGFYVYVCGFPDVVQPYGICIYNEIKGRGADELYIGGAPRWLIEIWVLF